MTSLSKKNPLFSPVQYNGEVYFTSQYFHQQYHANKPEGGKYSKLSDFNRLIRSIESYQKYIDRGDIVELEYKSLKELTDATFAPVKQLFKSSNYNPIMLINATAQVALTHHLDDEVSKSISVAVNEKSAKSEIKPKYKLSEIVSCMMMLGKEVANVTGVKPSMAMAGVINCISDNTGLSTESLRHMIPSEAFDDIGRFNAGALGKEIGLGARAVNQKLNALGLQFKNDRGEWELTESGQLQGESVPFQRNGHSGYQILWNRSVIALLDGNQEAA